MGIAIIALIIAPKKISGSLITHDHREVDSKKVDVPIEGDTIEIQRNTVYHPTQSQCQGNPLVTADMSIIDLSKLKNRKLKWVALSRDLIKRWGGPINYGDTILIISEINPQLEGLWIVHDCMNARYDEAIDFLFHPSNNSGIKWPEKTDLKIIY